MSSMTPQTGVTREEILNALSALGEDPDVSRVEKVRLRVAAHALPADADREASIRQAVEGARSILDRAQRLSRAPMLLGPTDESWRSGDTVAFGRNNELHAAVVAGLFRYSGLSMGLYYSVSGRIHWLDQAEAASRARNECVPFVYWNADSALAPAKYTADRFAQLRLVRQDPVAAERSMSEQDRVDTLRRALEIIAVGDATDGKSLAEQALLAAALWGPSDRLPVTLSDGSSMPTDVRKQVLEYTVLHDYDTDFSSMSLEEIARECRDGGYVGGGLGVLSSVLLTRDQLEVEARRIGTDAAFFDAGADDADEVPSPSL